MREVRWWALLPLMLLPWLAHAAEVQASLDRSKVELGETVTLNLHSEQGGPLSTPDLSALSHDFAVLGKSSGQTLSIINGQRRMEFNIGIALRPLHQGELRIPPLQVGGQTTQPLTLSVTAPDPSAAIDSNKPVFLEASVEPGTAYVGQQVTLSVKLYFTANLANAALADPAVDGVDISRVGGDRNYQADRNGRIYNVIERRYMLVPHQSGELTIPPVQFQGDLLDPNDPDSFLGMGAPVSAVSAPQKVQVRDVPADWGTSAWLPARSLSLRIDGLPDEHAPLRVGQPFNLDMTLEATGLAYDALPALSLPALDGATSYPDKPVTGNRTDGPWVVGRRQQRFAVVPEKAGTLVIPAITLKWWNVVTRQAETATLPAHRYQVLPASGAATAPPPGTPAAGSSTPAKAATVPQEADAAPDARAVRPWRRVALASLGLWLLSMLAWLLWRRFKRRRGVSPTPRSGGQRSSRRELKQAFLQATRGADATLQSQALLAWARSERPAVTQLQALSAALASSRQREAIDALQRQRYAAGTTMPAGPLLAAAFADGFAWQTGNGGAGGDEDDLPPLYPFRLH